RIHSVPHAQDRLVSRRSGRRARRSAAARSGAGAAGARVRRRDGLGQQSLHLRRALPHLPACARHRVGGRRAPPDPSPPPRGALTISKSISIQGHGFAGISTSSGVTAITINANNGDKINLRGLLIEGSALGQDGIVITVMTGSASLNIQDSVVRNLAGQGIRVNSGSQ